MLRMIDETKSSGVSNERALGKVAEREENCDPALNEGNASPSASIESQSNDELSLDEDSTNSDKSEASESILEPASEESTDRDDSEASESTFESVSGIHEKLQGNPTIEKVFAKFKKESNVIRKAMQKWVVVAQSTHYVSSVLTALVPRLLVSDS